MSQMARILIGHAGSQLAFGFYQPYLSQIFINVPYLGRELPRPLRVDRVILQQRGIFLQRRSAACRVAHDGVELRAEHGIDVAPRLITREVEITRVQLQRAAARLALRNMYLNSVLSQQADRGAIQLSKSHAGHTSDQQSHPAAPFALRRKNAAE